jgi:ribonuclease-3
MNNTILGYQFKSSRLLQEALTHPSVCVKNHSSFSYERLELLGDAALSLVVLDLLMVKYPNEDEGSLAKRKAALVSGETLAKIAFMMNLGDRIEMTKSEEVLGGRESAHNLENVMEAIIGAIYLDSGIEVLKTIIQQIWQPFINEMRDPPTDPKSKLQEILQKDGKALPKYELIDASGPKHMLTFRVSLKVSGFEDIIGEGKSKQQAEKAAAILLLEKLLHE